MHNLRGSTYAKKILLLLPLSVIGIIIQLYSTRIGAGVSPDSTQYLSAAQTVLQGQGLQILGSEGELIPLMLWPPLFPFILAFFGRLGIDVYEAARVWNAVMIGANVFLIGVIIARITYPSKTAPIVGSVLLLLSVDFVSIHAWVWSDPTMLFVGFLGLLLLDKFLVEKKHVFLLASVFSCGLCLVTRYAAIPFVIVGCTALLLFQRGERLIKRLFVSIAYGILSLLPLIMWTIRNQTLTGNSVGREFGFDVGRLRILEVGLKVVSDWVLPGRITGEIRGWIGGLFLLTWLMFAVIYAVVKAKEDGKSRAHGHSICLPQLLVLFFLIYSFMLLFGNAFFQPGFPLNNRIMIPLYIVMVIVSTGIAYDVFHWVQPRFCTSDAFQKRIWSIPILVLLSIIAVGMGFKLVHMGKWLKGSYEEGLGYASRAWRNSAEIRFIEDLPLDALIYSNGPDAIYFLADRLTTLLPGSVQDAEQLSGTERSSIHNMREDLLRNDGYIVYFRGITWRETLGEVQLHQFLDLLPIFGTQSGSIFKLE